MPRPVASALDAQPCVLWLALAADEPGTTAGPLAYLALLEPRCVGQALHVAWRQRVAPVGAAAPAVSAVFELTAALLPGDVVRVVQHPSSGTLQLDVPGVGAVSRPVPLAPRPPLATVVAWMPDLGPARGSSVGFWAEDAAPSAPPADVVAPAGSLVLGRGACGAAAGFWLAAPPAGLEAAGSWTSLWAAVNAPALWQRPPSRCRFEALGDALVPVLRLLPGALVPVAFSPFDAGEPRAFPAAVVLQVGAAVPPGTSVLLWASAEGAAQLAEPGTAAFVWTSPAASWLRPGDWVLLAGLGGPGVPSASRGTVLRAAGFDDTASVWGLLLAAPGGQPVAAVYTAEALATAAAAASPAQLGFVPGVSMHTRPWPPRPAVSAVTGTQWHVAVPAGAVFGAGFSAWVSPPPG